MSEAAKAAIRGALAALPPKARLGVAVSGGGDSVALLHLALEVVGPQRLCLASVDHRLRPEAAREAAGVVAMAAALGLRGEVLEWQGHPVSGNLMDAARRARQELLAAWAAREGLAAVLLGHTQDDQAETLLMRLARGSGVDGLAAMAPARRSHGTLWLRPLLGISRADLRAALEARGVAWVEDPSNRDPQYQRVRAREALALLAPLGLSAEGLAATASRMARARAALESATLAALTAHLREAEGVWHLAPEALDLPPEIRDRLFAALIRALGRARYPLRHEALGQVLAALAAGRAAMLSGVVLHPGAAGVQLWREAAAVTRERVASEALWDGRWQASGPGAINPLAEIAALGEAGLQQLSRQAEAGLHPHWRETGLPRAALAGLPAIWMGERLIAAPLALWPEGWRLFARPAAELVTGLSAIWPESD